MISCHKWVRDIWVRDIYEFVSYISDVVGILVQSVFVWVEHVRACIYAMGIHDEFVTYMRSCHIWVRDNYEFVILISAMSLAFTCTKYLSGSHTCESVIPIVYPMGIHNEFVTHEFETYAFVTYMSSWHISAMPLVFASTKCWAGSHTSEPVHIQGHISASLYIYNGYI